MAMGRGLAQAVLLRLHRGRVCNVPGDAGLALIYCREEREYMKQFREEMQELEHNGLHDKLAGLRVGMSFGEFKDEMTPWVLANLRRKKGPSHGGGGTATGSAWGGWLAGLLIVIFIAYIALNLISTFAPTIGNLTYSGGGVGATIFSLVQTWFLPLAMIGLLIYLVMHFLGSKK